MDHRSGMKDHHHMWMWFHTTVDDTVLFDFWVIDTTWKMVVSCAAIFVLGVALEALKCARYKLEVNASTRSSSPANYRSSLITEIHAIQTLLFAVQLALSYILMLVFMTFSIWLALAITLGITFGYFIFGYRLSPPNRLTQTPQSTS